MSGIYKIAVNGKLEEIMKLNIGDFIKMKEENFACQILAINDDNYLVKHRDKDVANFTVWFEEIDKKATKKLNLKVITDMSQSVVNGIYRAVANGNKIFIDAIEYNSGGEMILEVDLEKIAIKQLNKILKIFGFIYKM